MRNYKNYSVTTLDSISNYYKCNDCNALWREINKSVDYCKFCGSSNIEKLSTDEWLKELKPRLDDDEYEEMEQNIYQLIDLGKTLKFLDDRKKRWNIN